MEKANKKVLYEYLLVNNAFQSELAKMDKDKNYSRWHYQNVEWYRSFGERFNSILGYTGNTQEEFMDFITSIELSPEQKRLMTELRREPMFKKLMGEASLQKRTELETALGSIITSKGMTFASEDSVRVATKTEQQLEEELNAYNAKLSELFSKGSITQEQYDSYNQNLDYIYSYYISQSKGEQIPFRKMTNVQYEQIEQKALENGISFSEQLAQETTDLMDTHDEIQELQSQGIKMQ